MQALRRLNRKMRILKSSVAVICTALTLEALAQQPPPSQPSSPASTITVDARLVIVPVVVRDKKNALVPAFGQENFALQVDGKAQPVRYFDHDADVPLTVGLLIDTSLSQRNVLDEERAASATFLEKMLADRDQAFLLEFARAATLLQDVTNSRPKLEEALKQLDSPRPEFQRDNSSGSTGGDSDHEQRDRYRDMMSHAGTVMYDSVFLASEEVMEKQHGRRALILLTDGDDHGSLKTLAKAIESAQRADTIVYAIYYKDDHGGYGGHGGGFGGPGGGYGGHHGGMGGPGGGYGGQGGYQHVDGRKVLEQMCGETGGRMFEVTKKETVEKIYAEIGEELRSQYRLGFTPTSGEASVGYHKVEVGLIGLPAKAKDQVQARDGYYKR